MILLRNGEFIMELEEYEFFLNANDDLVPLLPEYEFTEQKYYLIPRQNIKVINWMNAFSAMKMIDNYA